MPSIQVNDIVQASLYNEVTNSTATQRFKVLAIDGTVYEGGALPCDTASGWVVEIILKDLANLNLPSSLSEITVVDRSGNKHYLTGKDLVWRDAKGSLFDVNLIVEWTSGHQIDDAQIAALRTISGQTDVEG
jgi:hypothetical protein